MLAQTAKFQEQQKEEERRSEERRLNLNKAREEHTKRVDAVKAAMKDGDFSVERLAAVKENMPQVPRVPAPHRVGQSYNTPLFSATALALLDPSAPQIPIKNADNSEHFRGLPGGQTTAEYARADRTETTFAGALTGARRTSSYSNRETPEQEADMDAALYSGNFVRCRIREIREAVGKLLPQGSLPTSGISVTPQWSYSSPSTMRSSQPSTSRPCASR